MMQARMSRKVVLFGPLPPPYGGVSVYMSALYEHLKPYGVRMWALYGNHAERDGQTTFVNHRGPGVIRVLLSGGRDAQILDASHFHLEYPNAVLLPLWLVAKLLLGFTWQKNVHDGSLPARFPSFSLFKKGLFQLAIRNVDEFIVVSVELERWLREEIGVTKSIRLIPSLLPIPSSQLERSLNDEIEKQIAGFFNRTKRVCSIGVFIESYGFANVAEAVERLRVESGQDIGLALVDGTFARDDNYRKATLAGRDWITLVENVPNADVYQILKRSHVFARAFAHESYGISRVEATWCGLPVVATNVGETRGMLTYDFGDVDELTNQLRRALFEVDASDVKELDALFKQEAEENLNTLILTLGLEPQRATSSDTTPQSQIAIQKSKI
jgi:glycosyltransferase involved in cell wall biosynthesis